MTDEPLNDFEIALVDAMNGGLPIPELFRMLVHTELIVVSATEVMEDGSGFRPLLFPKGDTQMLACFSDQRRIGEFSSLAPYFLALKGADIFRRMPEDNGLVINPGSSIGLEVSPEGVKKILSEFVNSSSF